MVVTTQSGNDDDDDVLTNDQNPIPLTRTVQQTFGLLSRPFYDDNDQWLGCVRYASSSSSSSSERDTKFRTGQAMGILTILILTMTVWMLSAMVVMWWWNGDNDRDTATQRRRRRRWTWRCAHYGAIAAAVTQLLTLLALGSTDKCYGNDDDDDDEWSGACRLSSGAKLAIFNTVLLDGIGLFWFFVTVPDTSFWQVRCRVGPTDDMAPPEHDDPMTRMKDETCENHACVDDTESIISEYTNDESNLVMDPSHLATKPDLPNHHPNTTVQPPPNLQLRYQWQYQLTIVGFIGLAWMISILGVHRCTLVYAVEATNNADDYYYNNNDNVEPSQSYRSGIGLYQMAIHDNEQHFLGCVAYPSHMIPDTLDGPFRTARAFGAITTLLTSCLFLLNAVQLFATTGTISKIALANRILLPLAVVSEATTFAIFRSQVCDIGEQGTCRLGGIGKIVILNILLLAVITVLVSVGPIPKEPLFEIISTNSNIDSVQKSLKLGVSTKPIIMGALSIFRIFDRIALRRNGGNDVDDDQISTDCSGTIQNADRNLNDTSSKLNVTSIVTQVEYSDTVKTTRKIITFQDGTQTVHTTIEEIEYDDDDGVADLGMNSNEDYFD